MPALIGKERSAFLLPQPIPAYISRSHRARICTRTRMSTGTNTSDAALTLFTAPVSMYAARARYIAARKNLSTDVMELVSPADLGGLKSEKYLAMNPLGKMPLLVVRDDPSGQYAIFESRVICEYLLDRFEDIQPTFIPRTLKARSIGSLVATLLDNYVGPHNYAMYKPCEPGFDRAAVVKQMDAGFDAIESALDETGPYVAGSDMSIGDVALLASFPFYDYMLPMFFGVNPLDSRPKLKKWHSFFLTESSASRQTYMEVWNSVEKWRNDGRWDKFGMKPLVSGKPQPPF